MNVFAPSVANDEQEKGRAVSALPDAQELKARLNVTLPLVPPPVIPFVPLTPVIVPVPGNVCPVANVTGAQPATELEPPIAESANPETAIAQAGEAPVDAKPKGRKKAKA